MLEKPKPIREIIEKTLAEYSGETVAGVAVYHIETTMGFNLGRAIEDPDGFLNALRQVYDGFVPLIEDKLCKNIAKEYGIKYKGEGFIEFVKKVRAALAV